MTAPTIPKGWRQLRERTWPCPLDRAWNGKEWVTLHKDTGDFTHVGKGETIIRRIVKRKSKRSCGTCWHASGPLGVEACLIHTQSGARWCTRWESKVTIPRSKRSCANCGHAIPRSTNGLTKFCPHVGECHKGKAEHWERKVKG